MKITLPLIITIGLCSSAQAQDAGNLPDTPKPAPTISKQVPKLSSPMDRFDMKTIDSGRKLQQRLELDVPNNRDTFIFGNKTTVYPMGRDPGQLYQSPIPQQTPQDRYSIGIGKRF